MVRDDLDALLQVQPCHLRLWLSLALRTSTHISLLLL